jgi:hypothetical protein
MLRSAATGERNLEVIAASKQRTRGAAFRFCVRIDKRCDTMAGDFNLNRAARRECVEATAVDVRDEITETIDPQHDAGELSTRDPWFWNVEHLPCRDSPA